MKETYTLEAKVREQAGSKSSAKLRKEGFIPVIVYGHKEGSASVSLNAHDFTEAIHHGHRLLELTIDGKKETTLIKDLQYDYLGKDIIHADLVRVNITEEVTVAVALELKGTAAGQEEGGVVEEHLDALEVECRVTDIPDSIPVNIKELGIGDAIFAKDVKLPAGMKLVTEPDVLIVVCSFVREEAEEVEEVGEEPASPEVIGRGKEEETETE